MALITDSASFILWVSLSGEAAWGGALWLGLTAACFIFILVESVLNHEWPRVVAGGCGRLPADDAGRRIRRPRCGRSSCGPAFWRGVWVLHRRHYEDRLANANRQTVLFRYEAQRARDEERQRIAADFHDGPLQSFIGMLMRLEILRKILARDPKMAIDELHQLQELCKKQVGELRTFVRSMRPAEVDGASLGASISPHGGTVPEGYRHLGVVPGGESFEPPEPKWRSKFCRSFAKH